MSEGTTIQNILDTYGISAVDAELILDTRAAILDELMERAKEAFLEEVRV